MTPEQLELSEQLVTHPRWRWRDGMSYVTPSDPTPRRAEADRSPPLDARVSVIDPATAGVLIDLLDADGLVEDIAKHEGEWAVAVNTSDGLKGWLGTTLGEAVGWAALAAWDD